MIAGGPATWMTRMSLEKDIEELRQRFLQANVRLTETQPEPGDIPTRATIDKRQYQSQEQVFAEARRLGIRYDPADEPQPDGR